jgi:hypothetical protein
MRFQPSDFRVFKQEMMRALSGGNPQKKLWSSAV